MNMATIFFPYQRRLTLLHTHPLADSQYIYIGDKYSSITIFGWTSQPTIYALFKLWIWLLFFFPMTEDNSFARSPTCWFTVHIYIGDKYSSITLFGSLRRSQNYKHLNNPRAAKFAWWLRQATRPTTTNIWRLFLSRWLVPACVSMSFPTIFFGKTEGRPRVESGNPNPFWWKKIDYPRTIK